MKVTYLGTAAAERVPAIFCNCRICRHAMEKKAGRFGPKRKRCWMMASF